MYNQGGDASDAASRSLSFAGDKHTWNEVHGQWPAEIVRTLFDILPAGFQAAPQIHLGSPVEADLSEQDEYEVRVYDVDRGRQLVAAIEIVSPSNKDRPKTREQFVGKVATLLQKGVCVSIVDLVTIRHSTCMPTCWHISATAIPIWLRHRRTSTPSHCDPASGRKALHCSMRGSTR